MARKKTFGTRAKISTLGAGLGSMEWIDLNYFNPFSDCLVSYEILQLEETPITQPVVHSFTSSQFSNPFKVLNHNGMSIKVIHDLLTDVVIAPSHKPFFSSRDAFQKPSAGTSAFTLKLGSQSFEFEFLLFDLFGIKELLVRSYSNIGDSSINAKNSVLEARAIGIDISGECEHEKASAFFINSQQAFINLPGKIFFVTIWNRKRDLDSSFDCGNAQDVILHRDASGEIVSHRTSLNNWLSLSLLNNPTRLFDTGNSNLRGQTSLSEGLIDERMELNIINYSSSPSLINAELQSFMVDFEGSNNLGSCFNLNPGCCSCFHCWLEDLNIYNTNGGDGSPPQSKQWGIRAIGK